MDLPFSLDMFWGNLFFVQMICLLPHKWISAFWVFVVSCSDSSSVDIPFTAHCRLWRFIYYMGVYEVFRPTWIGPYIIRELTLEGAAWLTI